MNYKAIVSSAMMALVITGCATNDNEDASENLGLNRTHQDNLDNPMNVSDTRQNVNNDNNDNGVNGMRVSEDISKRVEALKEVSKANVIVTENNAYVGAVLKDGGEKDISNDLKERVADAVRGADPSVDQVYVSANPDFVQRMDRYANDIENGKPVEGFAEEFRELVTRIFPSPR
ncbi:MULTISPECIES: YhcN/YlaJ family sporulation lipoprotein [unclassified Bacillus (in: firmicutes)]|uniref:YhcN/YlaJ family sporulation lipoprotein n=1 Tax=unclassified Bacillus (in: firmicutes) TaxID=185979 RepID=UPI001BEB9275|nr:MULTISPECIES: YhcN/YlaJ family sporulation lipoprotein [unclassified Bacillus (in: firmicutes)]MBT2615261.1 YhcN/YlaJ family sporulation lipoprotein [Bacillus sp. ISL-78]MBT2628126.1 YhcN/YlaJ family sporulation lipoprotein [Bacillus sp. ISL-101]MBT2717689.1 YhcN/YlaJ family sporulation lipoprotein [Bacillus sp. ISL-57]